MPYDLVSPFAPAGHQPRAIRELAAGLARDDRYQTLLGVTGSGKTMTMAHVIARLRLRATSSLMEREDVVIVASVSAIYGLGDPEAYRQRLVTASVGEERGRDALLEALVGVQYQRNDTAFERGTFRVRGDTIEVL